METSESVKDEVNMQGFLENRWNLLKLLIIIGILAALGLGHKINISAQEAQLVDFEVGVRVGEYTQTIEWYVEDSENGKEYFLFLPYFSKQKDIEVSFEGPEEIILNEQKVKKNFQTQELNLLMHIRN